MAGFFITFIFLFTSSIIIKHKKNFFVVSTSYIKAEVPQLARFGYRNICKYEYECSSYGIFPSVYSRDETIKSIDSIKSSFDINGFGLYALEKIEDSSFIGFTGFSIPRFESFFTPCVEIGWRLSFANWNQGFATEAAKACIDFGFSTLEFNVIHSFTSVLNVKSMHIMKKIGMHFAGTFDHPLIADGNKLKPHVIYKLDRENYSGHESTFF